MSFLQCLTPDDVTSIAPYVDPDDVTLFTLRPAADDMTREDKTLLASSLARLDISGLRDATRGAWIGSEHGEDSVDLKAGFGCETCQKNFKYKSDLISLH